MHAIREYKRRNTGYKRSISERSNSEREYEPVKKNSKYSLAESIWIDMHVDGDSILLNFFEELKKHCKELDDREASEHIEKLKKIKEPFRTSIEKKPKVISQLYDEIENFFFFSGYNLGTYKNPEQGSEVEYIPLHTKIFINGCELTNGNIEELIEATEQHYEEMQQKLQNLINKQKELEKRMVHLNKQLDRLDFLRSIFFSYKIEEKFNKVFEEYHHLQGKLHLIDIYPREIEKAKELLERLKKITPKQRTLISEFAKINDELSKLPEEEIISLDCNIRDIYGYEPIYYHISKYDKRRKYELALEQMLEDGSISEESIGDIMEKLEIVSLKRRALVYDDYSYTQKLAKKQIDRGEVQHIIGFLSELKEAYELEQKGDEKVCTPKDIVESSKQEKISLSDISDVESLLRMIAKDMQRNNCSIFDR